MSLNRCDGGTSMSLFQVMPRQYQNIETRNHAKNREHQTSIDINQTKLITQLVNGSISVYVVKHNLSEIYCSTTHKESMMHSEKSL